VTPPVVVVRTVFRGQVWNALPNYLIEDSPTRVVTALLPGACCQQPIGPRGEARAVMASGRWQTAETVWHTNRTLWVWPREAAHAVGLFWEHATDRFVG